VFINDRGSTIDHPPFTAFIKIGGIEFVTKRYPRETGVSVQPRVFNYDISTFVLIVCFSCVIHKLMLKSKFLVRYKQAAVTYKPLADLPGLDVPGTQADKGGG